jgi:hypothetical protein
MLLKMKMPSHFCHLAGYCPRRHHVLPALTCALAIWAVGCHQKDQSTEVPTSASPPTQTDATTPAPASPAPVANPGTSVTAATNALPDLRPLNQALLSWRLQNRRVPATFEEFAASTDVQIPPLPPGKKYVINSHGLISVVNR